MYLHKEKTRDREERVGLRHNLCINTILYHSDFWTIWMSLQLNTKIEVIEIEQVL